MQTDKTTTRFAESTLQNFCLRVFKKLGVKQQTAKLAVRSLLDASLMGIETHGVEALDMYVTHIQKNGLKPNTKPVCLKKAGVMSLWDWQHGFGLASARIVINSLIKKARKKGIAIAACRYANHIGACGVYGKIAADHGLIGIVTQQTKAALAPWGAKEGRIGASPTAFVAPVQGMFPFYFDASMALITGAQIKACKRAGKKLPEGVALDSNGNPTVHPDAAWTGLVLPIGGHKGVGLAMMFEILSCVIPGNRFSKEIPSIVSNPQLSADSGVFMMALNPEFLSIDENFAERMKKYVEYVESGAPLRPESPTRYPGRREGENWLDRSRNGIPVSPEGFQRFATIAADLGLPPLA